MEQESMIFYRSFYEALRDLDDDIRLELYDAIMRYSLYEEDVEVSPKARPFFRLISPQLDANLRRRKNGVYGVLGKEYGSLGGRPKKEGLSKKPPKGDKLKTPMGDTEKPPMGVSKIPPNINVNVNNNKNINKKFNDYPQTETDYSKLNIFAN